MFVRSVLVSWRQSSGFSRSGSCLCPISGKSSTIKILALRNLRCRCIVRIVCTWCCNTSGKSTIMTMIDDDVHVLYLSDIHGLLDSESQGPVAYSTVFWNLRILGTVHNCSCGVSKFFWIFQMIGSLSGQLVVSQQSSDSNLCPSRPSSLFSGWSGPVSASLLACRYRSRCWH